MVGDRDIYINILLDMINFFTVFGLQVVSLPVVTQLGLVLPDGKIFGK